MRNYAGIFVITACALCWVPDTSPAAEEASKSKPLPPIPLSLNEVHAWIDRSHPLLKGAGTEKTSARGKMLKALGAFEPVFVNDTEIERFIEKGTTKTQSVGFNDTLVEARTPWGFRGSAGIRQSIGDAKIPDLAFGNGQQVILGGFLPLLKGLMINPEHAELQRSELADPRAEVKISQTRQDLFLAAATQFWDWVSAAKFVDVQRRALGVAEERLRQVEGRAKAGAVAPLDVVEAGQEVQRRREIAIAAQRAVEQEQYKMSMFLWENQTPTVPQLERVPDFPPAAAPRRPKPSRPTSCRRKPTARRFAKSISRRRSTTSIWNSPKTISSPASIWKRRRHAPLKSSSSDWATVSGRNCASRSCNAEAAAR